MDSISRIWICGTGLLWPAGMFGLGSLTKRVMREMVGRTFREMSPVALICGVTLMTMPTGTVSAVVSTVVTGSRLVAPGVVSASILK